MKKNWDCGVMISTELTLGLPGFIGKPESGLENLKSN